MKVISGKLKGRVIKGYDIEGTRPTMDRVKESVFAMIQDYVNNSIILDLFAGTGNYGIEGISNGAQKVYFNDKNKKCTNLIKEELINFNILDYGVITNLDYHDALDYYFKNNLKFDLIFLDPPYKELIIPKVLSFIEKKNLLNQNGLIICEITNNINYSSNQLELFKERKYGEKIVLIYQNK